MKPSYLALLVMFVASPVWADWTFISENDEGTKVYIDYATIRKDGNFRTVWEVTNFKSPDSFKGAVYISTRAKTEYDCKEEKKRNLTTTAHSELFARGDMVWASESPSIWIYIPPQSVISLILPKVCGASVR